MITSFQSAELALSCYVVAPWSHPHLFLTLDSGGTTQIILLCFFFFFDHQEKLLGERECMIFFFW